MKWLGEYWRTRRFAMSFASISTLICIALSIGWVMLPSPGKAIYEEIQSASHIPDRMVASLYQFPTSAPTQKPLASQLPSRGFSVQVNHWRIVLPSLPIQIAIEPLNRKSSLPLHLKVTAQVNHRWVVVVMHAMPRFAEPPLPGLVSQSHAPALTVLLPPQPRPGLVQVCLSNFYTSLPRNAAKLRISGIWAGRNLDSVSVEYTNISLNWLHERKYPFLRHIIYSYTSGRGPYENVIWWGLIHAGMPPWEVSHVIASAARRLLHYSDMQLMRRAFSANMAQLLRAAPATKAIQMAILMASLLNSGHQVFWARTVSKENVCFWLQNPWTIKVEHFSRTGDAYADEGIIQFSHFSHAGNTKFIFFSKNQAQRWDQTVRKTVEKGLPFFTAGPPWKDIHATKGSKN